MTIHREESLEQDAHGAARMPTPDEIAQMTAEEAMLAGAAVDGVQIVHRRDRYPIPGTRAERRAEWAVSSAFIISFLAAIAFVHA